MPKISQTSKMKITGKRVGSWSLPAGVSCPGAKDAEVCKTCYAKKGMYRFPVVKSVREYNREDYKKDDWVDRMVKKVNKFDYFRWFDSGDVESVLLARKIRNVIELTPNVKHWLPTRSDKLKTLQYFLQSAVIYPSDPPIGVCRNVALRPSADNIGFNKPERPGVNSFVIRPTDLFECKNRSIYLCPVTAPGSTQTSCDTCTVCYTNTPVAYMLH